MLDIGWQELLVIGALALIVVGPKDLPGMLRTFGQWVGRMRGMARDFQRAMNDAARDADMGALSELNDLRNTVSGSLDFKSQASKAQSFLNSEAADKPEKKAEPAGAGPADDPAGGPVTEATAPAETAPAADPAPAEPKAAARAADT